MVEGVDGDLLGDHMSRASLQTVLNTGISSWVRVDTYVIGSYTLASDVDVVKRGAFSSSLGLDAQTLDLTIAVGGSESTLGAMKADALAGTLDNASFTWTTTMAGEAALRFTGTVQRAEVSSTEIRIVAITSTVKLDAVMIPTHVIMPAEFPEIPPAENYNIR
jgi:hypothetical protein